MPGSFRSCIFGVRWSSLNQTDGLIASGELDIFSLGLTCWLSPVFIINANDRYTESEQGGFNGDSSAVMTRFLLLLE